MPIHQHHKKDGKAYNAGANRDFEEEFLGGLEEGEYIDAKNMHPTKVGGDTLALSKIDGDTSLYPLLWNPCSTLITVMHPSLPLGDYVCQSILEINDDIVDVWVAANGGVDPSIIRVNGTIVCAHIDLPFRQSVTDSNGVVTQYHLQAEKNESCIGGEIYYTDNRTPPLIFNLKDMKENAGLDGGTCTDKYFAQFDINAFTININAPSNAPRFVGLVPGNGLPPGEYQYAFRYVSQDGDRTEWSTFTPPIPVTYSSIIVSGGNNNIGSGAFSSIYPGSKLRGGTPTAGAALPATNPQSTLDGTAMANPTAFDIRLKIRINNKLDYDYIQIQRMDYNLGQSFMPPTFSSLVAEIPIIPQENRILIWEDSRQQNQPLVVINEDDQSGLNTIIDRAKTLRYYNSRLFFMNIKEASRDVTGVQFTTATLGAEMQPIMHNSGTLGQNDAYNHVYHKPYMSGEKYGFAVVFYDSTNSPSFALPVTGSSNDQWFAAPNPFTNYTMPNRRNAMSAASNTYSYQSGCVAATVSGTVTSTFEVFDHTNAIDKTNVCPFVNIYEPSCNVNNVWNWVGWPAACFMSLLSGKSMFKLNKNSHYGRFSCDLSKSAQKALHPHDSVTVLGTTYSIYFWSGAAFLSALGGNIGSWAMILSPLANPYNIGFKPFRPAAEWSQAGSGYDLFATSGGWNGYAGHDYAVTTKCAAGSTPPAFTLFGLIDADWDDYDPDGFAFSYLQSGMALDGIDTTTLPSWVNSFSVVRTDPAGRVFAQGIGHYAMLSADGIQKGTTKLTNTIWFYSPDTDTNFGWIDMNVATNSIQSAGSLLSPYKLQLVSPLGFFTETYSGVMDDSYTAGVSWLDVLQTLLTGGSSIIFNIVDQRWFRVDMITYSSIIYDNGQINPGETNNMGISSGGSQYVAFGKWRSQYPSSDSSGSFTTYSQGGTTGNVTQGMGSESTIFNITQIQQVTVGRGQYYKITVDRNIYNNAGAGTNWNSGFNDDDMMDWSEPMYICNIINTRANVQNNVVNTYYHTGTHINLRSEIATITQGMISLGTHRNIQLADERIEDCAPHPQSTTRATDNRFVWVNGNAWLNVTYRTNAAIGTLAGQVQAGTLIVGGNSISGLYTHLDESGAAAEGRNYSLTFQQPTGVAGPDVYTLQDGDVVEVRYDNNAPVRVWGGDSNVGEAIWAPIDLEVDNTTHDAGEKEHTNNTMHWWEDDNNYTVTAGGTPSGTSYGSSTNSFVLNRGFPFRYYSMNPRIYLYQPSSNFNRIQNTDTIAFKDRTFVRQMVNKFTCESRVNINFAFSLGHDTGTQQCFPEVHYVARPIKWEANNPQKNIFPEYFDLYPNEDGNFRWGGFRFRPNVNWDYSSLDQAQMEFSRPLVGFVDESIFCTRVIWSEKRDVNQQDSPGVRTFPAQNRFDISDDTGEIKYAYDALSGKGSNLYAVTDSGICLLITDKRTLSSFTGEAFTSLAVEEGAVITDQFWISKITGMSDQFWRTAAEHDNILYFANKSSVYSFMDNQLKDIGRIKYFSKIHDYITDGVGTGYGSQMSGCYDTKHMEYIFGIEGKYQDKKVLVWSEIVQHWVGEYDYEYEKYMSYNNRMFGALQGSGLRELNIPTSFSINGGTISSYVDQASSKDSAYGKEFFRFKINSNTSPSSVDFLDPTNYPTITTIGSVINTDMRVYDGFEQYIPRRTDNQNRYQGRLCIYRINHTFANEMFRLVNSVIDYKILK